MFSGEPPRTAGDLNFEVLGFPVRVHPFFWLAGLLLHQFGDLQTILAWMIAFFVGILLHELGHAVVMRRFGASPWIILYGFGGMAVSNRIQYGATARQDTVRQIMVSAAGPLAGFVLAAIMTAALWAAGFGVDLWVSPFGVFPQVAAGEVVWRAGLTAFINDLLQITVIWGILNLLPVYPMDGGQIARELLQWWNPRSGIRWSFQSSFVVAALLCAMSILWWKSLFMAMLFGMMAFMNYTALQGYESNRWR